MQPPSGAPVGRYDFVALESVVFGPGSARSLGTLAEERGAKRVLVIASSSVASVVDVEGLVGSARVADVFTGGRPHVPVDDVLAASQRARNLDVDGLVTIGGGSATDLGKAVNLCLSEDVRTPEQLRRWRVVHGRAKQAPRSLAAKLPHIAASTTLSAGEFTAVIGVTDSVRGTKDIYSGADLVPRVVVLDPELAGHTPRALWAATGIKALDHAIETLCSTRAQPVTDALAYDALHRLLTHLAASVKDSDDLEAAGQCQLAAWQSIFGLSNVKLGLSHGIAHQLGSKAGVPHGIASCVLLPTVLEFNAVYTTEAQRRIAALLASATGHRADLGAPELLRRYISSLGLPTRLNDVGVDARHFAFLARHTMTDPVVETNPRPVQHPGEIVNLLAAAW